MRAEFIVEFETKGQAITDKKDAIFQIAVCVWHQKGQWLAALPRYLPSSLSFVAAASRVL